MQEAGTESQRVPFSNKVSALARFMSLECRTQCRESGMNCHSLPKPQADDTQAEGSPGQKHHSLWESFQLSKELPALDQLHISKHFPVLVGPEEALECFHAGPGQGGMKCVPETCQLPPTRLPLLRSLPTDQFGTSVLPPLKILLFLGP